MTRERIIEKVQKYFTIDELVGSRTAARYKERAWRFLDTDLLHAILIVRENLDRSMTVNYGSSEQRGLRTNIQSIVKDKTERNKLYISAHILGKAVDFDIKGMTAQQVRDWIIDSESLFPFKIRLEDGVTWVHLDVISEDHNPKIYLFNP